MVVDIVLKIFSINSVNIPPQANGPTAILRKYIPAAATNK